MPLVGQSELLVMRRLQELEQFNGTLSLEFQCLLADLYRVTL